jgi:hypothetical protein
MSIINSIKRVIPGTKSHTAKTKRAATALRTKRTKYAPIIGRIAKEYGASVDILNTSAYVYKTVKGQERGVHIYYNSEDTPDEIRNRLDKTFTGSTTASRIKHAGRMLKEGAKAVKQVKKDLKESGIGFGGSMYGDPSNLFK